MEPITDFNQALTLGNIEEGLVNAVIEIPLGGTEKIEWNHHNNEFQVDSNRPDVPPEPVNYGFIPRTLSGDGDELDILVIDEKPVKTGSVLQVKVIGIMKFIDEGATDDKIIAVLVDNQITELDDIPKKQKSEISKYFSHYKDYKSPGCTKVLGWYDKKSAKKVIRDSSLKWKSRN